MASLDEKKIKEFIEGYTYIYAGNRFTTPPEKSYKHFTASDIAKLPTDGLKSLRLVMTEEKYSITDQILPDGMSRAEFTRSVLRELARRGEAADKYTGFPTYDTRVQSQPTTVERSAFIIESHGKQKSTTPEKVTEPLGVLAIHDAVVDITLNDSAGLRVSSDIAKAAGLTNGRIYTLDNDAQAYDFGYTAGSMQQFRKDNGLKILLTIDPDPKQQEKIKAKIAEMIAGKTDAEVEKMRGQIQAAVSPMSSAFVQENYCKTTDFIFDEGRFRDNRTAMVLGFTQARIDNRTDFQPSTDRIGLFGECTNNKVAQR